MIIFTLNVSTSINTLATHRQGTKTQYIPLPPSAPPPDLISVPQGQGEAGLLTGGLLPRLSVRPYQPPGLDVTSLGLRTKHSYVRTMRTIEVITPRSSSPRYSHLKPPTWSSRALVTPLVWILIPSPIFSITLATLLVSDITQ